MNAHEDRPGPSKRRLATVLSIAVALSLSCAGATLKGRVAAVDELIATARANGAQRCAPVELAMAESHADFARADLSEGQYYRARSETHIAEKNAREALRKSPKELCAPATKPPPKVVVKEKDKDGDGILDKDDRCPSDPEDQDGFEDEEGCPDPDNDKDGILDESDKCPLEAEDQDRFEDEDGCPDPDNDKDGILDESDKCPLEAEDKDGFEDEDGCPDSDNDKDGLADDMDKCPLAAEDKDGFEDEDGCPDCDNDGDGVPECPDVVDMCPNKAADTPDGCPVYKLVVVTEKKIELKQTVFFEYNKTRIRTKSYALLDDVALVLKDNDSIRVRIEGHTDSRGGDQFNLRLSQGRAESVRDYLVGRGIDPARMQAQGFGETQPIADNRTEKGRAQNRRVEFVILDR